MNNEKHYRTWKKWDGETFANVSPEDRCYFEAETKALRGGLGGIPVVLEIGFGNGNFAQWAVSRGWQYRGSEIDLELVTLGLAKGFNVHLADVPWPKDAFDLVVAFDVLEHIDLSDIPQFLVAIRDCLKGGGVFLARFPSGDSPFARHIQYGDLSHRTQIGTGMVQQLSLATGLEVVEIRAPAFPIWGLGLRRALRRFAVAVARKFIGVALGIAFFDNHPRVITPNMIVVLRKRAGDEV